MRPVVHAPELKCDGGVWLNCERPLSLADFRGKLLILDFFTSCCVNCRHVLATLERLEAARPHVQVVGVHAPKFTAERDPAVAAAAVARLGARHPVLHDPDREVMRRYAARAWPTLTFVDPHGRILGASSGEPDYERLLEAVDALIEGFHDGGDLHETPALLQPPTRPSGRFHFPAKVKPLDHRPGVAVADAGAHQVAMLDANGREIARYGVPEPGFVDGGPLETRFRHPEGLACVGPFIYVADTGNHALRRIDVRTGRTVTLAGDGSRGGLLGAPISGLATALASPSDLAATPYGLAFANAGSHQIGLFHPDSGAVTLLAGSGREELYDAPAEEAALAQPSGLSYALDEDALYLVDAETSALRRVLMGGAPLVETLIGAGLFDWGCADGPFATARLQHPQAVAALGSGRVAVADSYNDAVRLVDLRLGRVITLRRPANDADADGVCADGLCAPHAEPSGLCALAPNRLILAETNRHRLTELTVGADGTAQARPFA